MCPRWLCCTAAAEAEEEKHTFNKIPSLGKTKHLEPVNKLFWHAIHNSKEYIKRHSSPWAPK